jgi:hypothetical protein
MAIARHLEIAAQLLREPNVPPLDRVAYTPLFDELRDRFSALTGQDVSSLYYWRVSLDARKRGLVGTLRRRRRSAKA